MARVLVVDDHESLRELLGYFFRDAGHEVVLASDGQEAWRVLAPRGGDFDLILSDQDMPGMTGLDFLRLIRSDNRTAEVRFTLMSGERYLSSPEMLLEDVCADLGAGFIEKPFHDFAKVVAELLGDQS